METSVCLLTAFFFFFWFVFLSQRNKTPPRQPHLYPTSTSSLPHVYGAAPRRLLLLPPDFSWRWEPLQGKREVWTPLDPDFTFLSFLILNDSSLFLEHTSSSAALCCRLIRAVSTAGGGGGGGGVGGSGSELGSSWSSWISSDCCKQALPTSWTLFSITAVPFSF